MISVTLSSLLPFRLRQYYESQHSLQEMENKCQVSHAEWEELQEELRLCKEEIERLNGTVPIGGRVIPRERLGVSRVR